MSHIGVLKEKPLHAALKAWYAAPGDRFEVPVDGFVVDIVRGHRLVEIQTAGLASLASKLDKLLVSHQVRLVYPIAQEKWIVKLPTGKRRSPSRRKSPKRGRLEDLFLEMVSFPQLLKHPHFSLEVLLIREDEVRRYDGTRGWRRKGWVVEERRLLGVTERHSFDEPTAWRALLPADLSTFTVKQLAHRLEIGVRLAQCMTYCLRKTEMIAPIGKQGRAPLYRVHGA